MAEDTKEVLPVVPVANGMMRRGDFFTSDKMNAAEGREVIFYCSSVLTGPGTDAVTGILMADVYAVNGKNFCAGGEKYIMDLEAIRLFRVIPKPDPSRFKHGTPWNSKETE